MLERLTLTEMTFRITAQSTNNQTTNGGVAYSHLTFTQLGIEMKKVIILNGPPGSGKDTVANEIFDLLIADEILSFKEPIFNIAKTTLGEDSFCEFMELYNNRETKESPAEILNGMSPRQFMIHISEAFIKPSLGKKYFGDILAYEVSRSPPKSTIVVTDGGFPEELVTLAKMDYVELHIVRLHRQGCSFKDDSRNYIDAADVYLSADGECHVIHDHDISLVEGDIDRAVADVIGAISSTNS